MKYDQYVSLIQRLELSAAKSRRIYELKVLGLGLLGYAYMIGLIVLCLIFPVGLLLIALIKPAAVVQILLWTLKLWWAVLPGAAIYFGFVGSAVKALFAKMPEPEGRVLERSEAPELHAFVVDTCKKLRSAVPENIFVTDEFNASVATVPRIGLFGSKVYMFVGLPVLTALTPEQFKAVLAHEIGHISGKHGGYGKWAYQLRGAWGLFIDSQDLQEHKLAGLYRDFVNWFFPYFQAYSFVLLREHEKEADDYAVEITGSKALGEALVSLHTRSSELEQVYWPRIDKENQQSSEISPAIFSGMLSALRMVDETRDTQTIEKAIQVPTDYNDSHPSLAERLKRIGYWNGVDLPLVPIATETTAAEFFLGEVNDKLISDFESQWQDQFDKTWKSRHDEFRSLRERAEELETKASEDKLTVEELLEKAGLVSRQDGNAAALPLLRQALEQEPDHPEANYTLGGVLLGEGDESGLALVERSMELDKKWKFAASDLAFQYLRSKGRLEEAKPFAAILEAHDGEMEAAEKERQIFSEDDGLIPHKHSEETVELIVRKIKYFEEISQIFLVRKDVEHFKDVDHHVLMLNLRESSMLKNRNDMKPAEILNSVVDRLSQVDIGLFRVIDAGLKKRVPELEQMPGALIFDRKNEV